MTLLSTVPLSAALQSAVAQAFPVATAPAAEASSGGGWIGALQVLVYLLVAVAALLVIVRQIRPLCRHWREFQTKATDAAKNAVAKAGKAAGAVGAGGKSQQAGANASAGDAALAEAEALAKAEALALEQAEEERRHLAVIAAAVHIMGNQPHKIVSIRPREQGWAQEGRREIALSHRFR